MLKGRVSANRFSLDESLVAERHFRRAIAFDPKYAHAYAELGTLLAIRFENDWSVPVDADREKTLYCAQKAISLDPELWLEHYAMGRLHSVFAGLNDAESHLRIAMSRRPEKEDARAYLGSVRNFRGEADGAAIILEQAIAAHPDQPFWYYFGLGHSLVNLQEHKKAEHALNRCPELASNAP